MVFKIFVVAQNAAQLLLFDCVSNSLVGKIRKQQEII